MYFLRGSLPWQGLKAATNKQKYEKIGEKKQTTSIKELCDGFPGKRSRDRANKGFLLHDADPFCTSEEFGIYLQYTRKLGFDENPDYDFLRELFNKVLKRIGETDDGIYDWMLLNNGKGYEVKNRKSPPCVCG